MMLNFIKPKIHVLVLIAMSFFIFGVIPSSYAYAQEIDGTGGPTQNELDKDLNQAAKDGVCDVSGNCGDGTDVSTIAVRVINFLLFVIGITSVIMIVVGGLRYVISAGDANAVKGAKDTILYAIIGLVVAFVAWGIVNFVTEIFTQPANQADTNQAE